MDFFAFADMIGADVSIERPAGSGSFYAEFQDAKTRTAVVTKASKESDIGEVAPGVGETPEEAMTAYAGSIQGKVLIFNYDLDSEMGGNKRREVDVPQNLTVPKLS